MDRAPFSRWLQLLLVVLVACVITCPAFAQIGDGGDGVDGADGADGVDGVDGGGGVDGGTVVVGPLPGAGVVIDAEGVLSIKRNVDTSGALARQRRREAVAALGREMARPSQLRKVSLNRLEQAVSQRLATGQGPSDEMLYLAGLTRLQYVFYYPDSHDIVVAGPAEGFMMDALGRPIGIASGRSVLQLEDLIVALRAFGPDGKRAGTVGCSIDPTDEGLQRMQQFLSRIGGRAVPSDTRRIVDGLQKSLGLQVVSINGISGNTHFANVMVEADYRMKLIGIGLERPPVRITSYVDRASPSSVSRNALQRWYFVPDYESVRVTDDGMAIELVGDGVRLVSADEMVRTDGTRQATHRVDGASKQFVESFTRRYDQLAMKVPVYAQLRNLIDMLIASAYIQQQDFYGQAEWSMEVFDNEKLLPVEVYAAPKQVNTAVNAIWKGSVLMTPIGGGVHINALKAISAEHIQPDEDGDVATTRDGVEVKNLADGQWWWD